MDGDFVGFTVGFAEGDCVPVVGDVLGLHVAPAFVGCNVGALVLTVGEREGVLVREVGPRVGRPVGLVSVGALVGLDVVLVGFAVGIAVSSTCVGRGVGA